jgi:serine/threonine protein kinase/Tol biopolymer transport system component
MSDSRSRISDLYHRALARPAEERRAFLDEACGGDAALRQELESLLRYESGAVDFLERPAAAAAVSGATVSQAMLDTRVGPYRIVSLLGAGGMGEVYRAHDSKLGRDVALKILPSHLTGDAERRARFAREARVLATLNHPNIGAIYGLEDAEGLAALVLELVEGPTLADRLARGRLPVPQALAIARQIAEALDAAHEKGIVHRDLKPANIVLHGPEGSRDLRVKVLDFGLAKLMAASLGQGVELQAGSLAGTEDGRILGTPAYMSPEQARGETVDKRTDIWAFGCVLFEMLTGQPAFHGDTATDTLARVVDHEPDWTALPADTPDPVRRLMRRCVQKDSTRRLRDIGDGRMDLEEAMSAASSSTVGVPRKTRRRMARVLLLTASLMTIAGILWLSVRDREMPGREPLAGGRAPVVAASMQISRLTFDAGLQTDPTLSPDGRYVAYSWNDAGNFDIYTQPIGGGRPVRVTDHAAHDWQPDWSVHDEIVFRSERDGGGLYVVPPTGGHERRLASFGSFPLWSPDGKEIIFTSAPAGIRYIVGRDGGEPRACEPCSPGAYGWYDDGLLISMLYTEAPPQLTPHLRVIELHTGAVRSWSISETVVTTFRELAIRVQPSLHPVVVWSPDMDALYFVGDSRGVSVVWRLDVDRSSRTVTGGPHRVAAMAADATRVSAARSTAALAFAAADRTPRLWSYPLDTSGRRISARPAALTSGETHSRNPDITPDGRLLTYSVSRPGGLAGVELRTMTTRDRVERTLRVSDPSRGELRDLLRLSPDGKHVVFRYIPPESTGRGRGGGILGPQNLRLIDLDTDAERDLTRTRAGVVLPNGWSSDGRFVVATFARHRLEPEVNATSEPTMDVSRADVHAGAPMSIGLLPLDAAPDAESRMRIVTTSEGSLWQPSMSPNGHWIAFVTTRGGVFRIAIVGSADGEWRQPREPKDWRYLDSDLAAKDKPRWSIDGRQLYYTSARGGLLNVWATAFDPASGTIGEAIQVTRFDGPGEQMPAELGGLEIGVARDMLIVPTLRPTGGIWLLHPAR